jgi:hypothetical protein
MGQTKKGIPGNEWALLKLRETVASGEAIAFVGAGASAGLYPLWTQLINLLADKAVERGFADRSQASQWKKSGATPQAIAMGIKRTLGEAGLGRLLYEIFSPRAGADEKLFTPTHEALLQIPFKGYITTNYDPGLVEARRVVRQDVANTSYATWKDGDPVQRWCSGEVFQPRNCPILFAHGCHDRSETIVLTSDDYHAAYGSGAYRRLFDTLWLRERLVFVGFGFSDPWLEFLAGGVIRDMVAGGASNPRHVAILGLRGREKYHPDLRRHFEKEFNAVVYYYRVQKEPSGRENHGELLEVLRSLEQDAPHVEETAAQPGQLRVIEREQPQPGIARPGAAHVPPAYDRIKTQRWVHETTNDERYSGRRDELERLDSWARDSSVRVLAVTGLGGLGKTSLVGHWLKKAGGMRQRPVDGLFFWSFYADRSVPAFLEALCRFTEEALGLDVPRPSRPANAAIAVLASLPLLVVLDGLEVLQEGPATELYGSLLDLDLRDFLFAACQVEHRGLVVLTSRFPFRDLTRYLGSSHRAMALDRLSDDDGEGLLSKCGVEGTAEARRQVSRKLEGHPLALRIFAAALAIQADRDPTRLLQVVFERSAMNEGEHLQAKICRLLDFYENALPSHRRALMRLISLFRSPVDPNTLKRLAKKLPETKDVLGSVSAPLLRQYLRELRTEQLIIREKAETGGDRFSCHPVLRDHFRRSMIDRDSKAALGVADLLKDRPASDRPKDVGEIEPILSAIELLQQAGNFRRADELYQGRLNNGMVFRSIPAPHEGLNCTLGFVADTNRQDRCVSQLGKARLGYYLNAAGLHGAFAGELTIAETCYRMAEGIKSRRSLENWVSGVLNMTWALIQMGKLSEAVEKAHGAILDSKYVPNAETKIRALVHYAYALAMSGEVKDARKSFGMAEDLQRSVDKKQRGLIGLSSIWWADLLLRARLLDHAKARTEPNLVHCTEQGWGEDVARCELILGKVALEEGDVNEAKRRLTAAEATMRKGHMMAELPQVLLARARQSTQELAWGQAADFVEEASEISRLRSMIPCHADSLIARARLNLARIRHEASSGIVRGDLGLSIARDDAESALMMARQCGYRWGEIDALDTLADVSAAMVNINRSVELRRSAADLGSRLRPPT